jgi:hypothetical protein
VISFLIYPSPYSPLVVAGTLPAAAILVALFRNPVWALYAAVFVVFFPGIILQTFTSSIDRLRCRSGHLAFTSWSDNGRVVWPPSTAIMFSLEWLHTPVAENLVIGEPFLGTR